MGERGKQRNTQGENGCERGKDGVGKGKRECIILNGVGFFLMQSSFHT